MPRTSFLGGPPANCPSSCWNRYVRSIPTDQCRNKNENDLFFLLYLNGDIFCDSGNRKLEMRLRTLDNDIPLLLVHE